jgi:hypothetical protein
MSRASWGPLLIELVREAVKAILLLQAVEPRRPGRFPFERKMHALVATILLGMAWLDTLDRNTEPEPPHRQL